MKTDSSQPLFEQIVANLLPLPGVNYPPADPGTARGFGSKALKVRGKIFAMVDSRGRFVVKLPNPRVIELIADGRGVRFEMGEARWMKEWVCLVPGTEDQWLDFAKEALNFVGRVTVQNGGRMGMILKSDNGPVQSSSVQKSVDLNSVSGNFIEDQVVVNDDGTKSLERQNFIATSG